MTDSERTWDLFEAAFGWRRWPSIRTSWPQFVGGAMQPSGRAPDVTLSGLLEEGGVLMSVPEKGALTSTRHPRGEIPELVFREAVFWLHKALHVLGASEVHVEMGLPTWSLSAAYQSAYFAARSMLGFLGVSVAELKHVSVAADLCRDMQGVRPLKMARIGAFDENVEFRSLGVLFDHRQIWLLFRRYCVQPAALFGQRSGQHFFGMLNISDITRQRHGLHYQLQYWVLDDLHNFVYSEPFQNVDPTGTGRELFDREKPNFSLAAGAVLTRMALALFKDVRTLTNRLAGEREMVAAAFSTERHPLFAETLRQEFGSAPVV